MTDSRPLYPAPADGARWRVLYEGSGFSMTEPHPDENAAYITARAAAERAATGEQVSFVSRTGPALKTVLGISILHWSDEAGDWRHHAWSWRDNVPSADALTPLPADFWN